MKSLGIYASYFLFGSISQKDYDENKHQKWKEEFSQYGSWQTNVEDHKLIMDLSANSNK